MNKFMDMESVRAAFSQRPDLQQRISAVIVKHPSTKPLFEDIARHVSHLQAPGAHVQTLSLNQAEHPSKKRKLESATDATSWDKVQSFADISFSIPVRKKLKLEIGRRSEQGFRGKNGNEIEFSAEWNTVRNIFCLPVPEKAQAQYNFCVITEGSNGYMEQILWTVPEAVPKDGTLDPPPSAESTDTYRTYLCSTIKSALKPHKTTIIEPTEAEFASQIVQAHRKSEKAYHVKAFRGSKDGFLFFLSTGIFWGFKKPLEFFSLGAIDSVSYTSVLQRTFNLNIVARRGNDLTSAAEEPQEFEFSMLDQVDFGGIDAYVKRHGLQDASMAEQRRAKKVNVNGVKGGEGADGEEDGGEGGVGELEKAAREAQDLQDGEDEEDDDENFDPGSEGESEGEGDDSEEEGGEEGDDGGRDDEDDDDDDDDQEADEEADED